MHLGQRLVGRALAALQRRSGEGQPCGPIIIIVRPVRLLADGRTVSTIPVCQAAPLMCRDSLSLLMIVSGQPLHDGDDGFDEDDGSDCIS